MQVTTKNKRLSWMRECKIIKNNTVAKRYCAQVVTNRSVRHAPLPPTQNLISSRHNDGYTSLFQLFFLLYDPNTNQRRNNKSHLKQSFLFTIIVLLSTAHTFPLLTHTFSLSLPPFLFRYSSMFDFPECLFYTPCTFPPSLTKEKKHFKESLWF